MRLNREEFIKSDLPNKSLLLEYFKQDSRLIIADIGCCEAEDSLRYSILFPNSEIYAVEPLPSNIAKCKANIERYKKSKIKLFEMALSDRKGESAFFVSEGAPEYASGEDDWDYGNKSSSLLKPDKVTEVFNWLKFKKEITVSTNTLLDFAKDNNLFHIDLLHLDVQGAEMLVLKGASKLMENIKVIWLEVENISLYKNQPLKKEITEFLIDRGFFVRHDGVTGVAGDMLFVNTKYFEDTQQKAGKMKALINDVKYKYFNKHYYQKTSFSQSGEDLIIDHCLKALGILKPSYLDIGSHHPFRYNNTYYFYNRGCRGINIEPDPSLYELFQKTRNKDINVNVGVLDNTSEIPFYILQPNTLNTFSKEECDNYIKIGHKLVKVINVKVETVADILERFNEGLFPELLSIDIEGLDLQVLRSLDLRFNYPKVICSETTIYNGTNIKQEKNKDIIEFLLQNGYAIYADTFVNTIFYKE
jgi:FkbM family methyltransferase